MINLFVARFANGLEYRFYLDEVLADVVYLGGVVYEHSEFCIEQPLVCLYVKSFDVEAAVLEERLCYVEERTHFVNSLYMYVGLEEMAVVHVPFYGYDVVAKLGLEFCGFFTFTLVDGEGLGGVVDIAECVVAWNRLAAWCNDAVVDVELVDGEHLFSVNAADELLC